MRANGGLQNETTFRYNNEKDFLITDWNILHSEEGYDVVKAWLPVKIEKGNRRSYLFGYCANLVWLNPNKSKEEVLSNLIDACEIRNLTLTKNDLNKIINSVFKYLVSGTLVPYINSKRKFLYGKKCGVSIEEKIDTQNKIMGEWRRNKTKKKIYEFLENYSGKDKITQKLVSKGAQVGLRTIERYWKEFSEFVCQLNNNL